MSDPVEAYYGRDAEHEWGRLTRHPMEFTLTMRALSQYLPPEARILDVGGGPGRYATELARRGHRVTLVDLSLANVELARVKAAEAGVHLDGFIHGNALDLSAFPKAAYDAVLLLGPLYHLVDSGQRDQALRQAVERLNAGGLLFGAYITRFAFLWDMLKYAPEAAKDLPAEISSLLDHGVTYGERGFTQAYFARPEEICPAMERAGLTTLTLLAAEGPISLVEPMVNGLEAGQFDAWAEICWRLAPEPSLLGAAEHLLYIGQKT